jgi:hypothetical protein
MLALVFSACAGIDARGGDAVFLGQQFTLPIGGRVTVPGENLTLEFLAVAADSRCPLGAQCIWAGEAKCDVKVTYCGETSAITLTESGGTDDFSKTTSHGYTFSFRLEPYPKLGKHLSPDEYELIMKIEKA